MSPHPRRLPQSLPVLTPDGAAEAKYLLKDKAKEAEVGDSLGNILARASARKLFDGITIYFTPSIEPAVKTLQKIANSGDAVVSLPLPLLTLPSFADPTPSQTPSIALSKVAASASLRSALTSSPPSAFVVSCAKDRPLWNSLASKHRVPVYSVEPILVSAMRQEIAFGAEYRIDQQVER